MVITGFLNGNKVNIVNFSMDGNTVYLAYMDSNKNFVADKFAIPITGSACSIITSAALLSDGPYDKVLNVTTGQDWYASANGISVCELRVSAAGNLVIDTIRSTNKTVPVTDYDVVRDAITRVYAGSTAQGITVHGFDS